MIVQKTSEAMMGRAATAGGATILLTQIAQPYADVFIAWQGRWFAAWGVTPGPQWGTAVLQALTTLAVIGGMYLRHRAIVRFGQPESAPNASGPVTLTGLTTTFSSSRDTGGWTSSGDYVLGSPAGHAGANVGVSGGVVSRG